MLEFCPRTTSTHAYAAHGELKPFDLAFETLPQHLALTCAARNLLVAFIHSLGN